MYFPIKYIVGNKNSIGNDLVIQNFCCPPQIKSTIKIHRTPPEELITLRWTLVKMPVIPEELLTPVTTICAYRC